MSSALSSASAIFALGLFLGMIISQLSLPLSRSKSTTNFGDRPLVLTAAGTTPHIFVPDDAFRLGANGSNEAWRSLIPEGLGFIQHPSLGPEIVGLAFVHQIHCLDQLRQALDSTVNHDPHHISHCIEYLRKSIICAADPNLEYRKIDEETGELATPGDDIHLCRDFLDLWIFAKEWRVYDGKALEEKRKLGSEDKWNRTIHYDYVSSRGDPVPNDA